MNATQDVLFDLPTFTREQALYRECRSMLGRPASLAELREIRWPNQWVKRRSRQKSLTGRARDMAQAIAALRLPPDPGCDDTELSGIEAAAELLAMIQGHLGRDPTNDELLAADRDLGGRLAALDVGCPCRQAMPQPQRMDALREQARRIAGLILQAHKEGRS